MPDVPDEVLENSVLVQVAPVGRGGRQIRGSAHAAESLEVRREDIQRGIAVAAATVGQALVELDEPTGWHMDSVEASFGITLGTEGTVLVAKASVEASFEVTLTFNRRTR